MTIQCLKAGYTHTHVISHLPLRLLTRGLLMSRVRFLNSYPRRCPCSHTFEICKFLSYRVLYSIYHITYSIILSEPLEMGIRPGLLNIVSHSHMRSEAKCRKPRKRERVQKMKYLFYRMINQLIPRLIQIFK